MDDGMLLLINLITIGINVVLVGLNFKLYTEYFKDRSISAKKAQL